MSVKSWEGSAVWREESDFFLVRRSYPAELRLDEKGGQLRSQPGFPIRSGADLRFEWSEVEKVEKVRLFGVPFFENVRFTLTETPRRTKSRTFLFGTMAKAGTLEMLDLAEAKGARVERKARFRVTYP